MKLPIYQISLLYGATPNESEIDLFDFLPKKIKDKVEEGAEILPKTRDTIRATRLDFYFNPEYSIEPESENSKDNDVIEGFTLKFQNTMKIPKNPQNMTKSLKLNWSPYDYVNARNEFILTILYLLNKTQETSRKPYDLGLYPNESCVHAGMSFVDEGHLKNSSDHLFSSEKMIIVIPPYNKSSLLRKMFMEYRNYKINNLEYPSELLIRNNYKGEDFYVLEGYDEIERYI